jgi:UDP-glucose 4-epimerase
MGDKDKNKKKVLLIGGEGFIGRNIVETIYNDFACFTIGTEKTRFDTEKRDFICRDPYKQLLDDEFDIYIHLVDNKADSQEFIDSEKRLMDNIRIKKNSHLIIFSSAVVYANPDSDYGRRKLIFEELYTKFCLEKGIRLTIFRLFNIFGHFQMPNRQGSLMANVFFDYFNEIPLEINDMSAKRDFVYAFDMGKVVKYVMENNYEGKYDLATGKLTSIGDMIELCNSNLFSNKLNIINKNNTENVVCPIGNDFLYKKIKQTPLVEALRSTCEFYEKNINLINEIIN